MEAYVQIQDKRTEFIPPGHMGYILHDHKIIPVTIRSVSVRIEESSTHLGVPPVVHHVIYTVDAIALNSKKDLERRLVFATREALIASL
jgi:hypothetical protein